MDDVIKRQDAIAVLSILADKMDSTGKTVMGQAVEVIRDLRSAQKTGKWIDKSRGDQKNSECSECHTLFRVLIHDYPYCPCCGSRNRGEEDD